MRATRTAGPSARVLTSSTNTLGAWDVVSARFAHTFAVADVSLTPSTLTIPLQLPEQPRLLQRSLQLHLCA